FDEIVQPFGNVEYNYDDNNQTEREKKGPQELPNNVAANLLQSISLGIDMFDCVMPTRNGRNGMLFTKDGILNMRNEKWKNDHSPIEEDGASYVDEAYSKAYLRHLLVSNEMLGSQIASQHNLAFYLWLMKKAGQMIDEGLFSSWKSKMMLTLEMRL
ncbi:MAG: tRNA-guanine transglycosylase, partial [Vicingaceae bacterium]